MKESPSHLQSLAPKTVPNINLKFDYFDMF